MTPTEALTAFHGVQSSPDIKGGNRENLRIGAYLRGDQADCMDDLQTRYGWSYSAQMRAAIDLFLSSYGYQTSEGNRDGHASKNTNGKSNSRSGNYSP